MSDPPKPREDPRIDEGQGPASQVFNKKMLDFFSSVAVPEPPPEASLEELAGPFGGGPGAAPASPGPASSPSPGASSASRGAPSSATPGGASAPLSAPDEPADPHALAAEAAPRRLAPLPVAAPASPAPRGRLAVVLVVLFLLAGVAAAALLLLKR
jgi:hypothetical protein